MKTKKTIYSPIDDATEACKATGGVITSITIRIEQSICENGYNYDIFIGDAISDIAEECGSEDGGQCTTSMKNAIDMACEQAKSLIK